MGNLYNHNSVTVIKTFTNCTRFPMPTCGHRYVNVLATIRYCKVPTRQNSECGDVENQDNIGLLCDKPELHNVRVFSTFQTFQSLLHNTCGTFYHVKARLRYAHIAFMMFDFIHTTSATSPQQLRQNHVLWIRRR